MRVAAGEASSNNAAQARTDLEELPVSDAVVTQEFYILTQDCNRLSVLLGVIKGESLIGDGNTGDQLEFVL